MEFPISLEKVSSWFVSIIFILYSTYVLIVKNKSYNIVINKKKLLDYFNIISFVVMLLVLLRVIGIYNSL